MEQKPRKITIKSIKDTQVNGSNQEKKLPLEREGGALASIYSSNESKNIDMTRLERKKINKGRLILYFVVILFVMLAIASLAGFFIFNRGQGEKGENIQLTVTAPKTVASGEEIDLEITYLNQGKVAVKGVDLTLLYPQGFYFSHSEPEAQNEAHTYWKIGEMTSGAGGRIKISGQMIGEIDATKTFQVSMQYTPANFSSVFETKEAYSLEITSSIIDLSLEAPLRIVSGQETEIKIKFKNNSDLSLNKIKIIATYPGGFSFKESKPESLEDQRSWLIDTLSNKEEETIGLKGIFQGNPGEAKEILVQLGLISENGEFRIQTEKSSIIYLVKPELNLQLEVNENNQELAADLGENLKFQVKYKNASEVELKNVVLKAEFISSVNILDFSKIDDLQNGKVEEKTITWGTAEIPAFASLVPSAEGSFSFTLPINSTVVPQKETDRNFSVEVVIKVVSLEMEGSPANFEKMSESNQVNIKINSKVNLEAEGRYYSEEYEKLGSGPLPPAVGNTTSYRIFWTISNLYNDVGNIEVSTILPKDVFWTGHATTSSGAVTFEADQRKVVWKITRLPANTGQLFPVAEANFEVSITPKTKDLGKLMVLANESTLKARDSFTNRDLSITDNLITTDLENDVAAQERGIVASENLDSNLNFNENINNSANLNSF